MDAGLWRGVFTVVMLLLFLGIWAWAWSGRRRSTFEAAARLPLEADDTVPPASTATSRERNRTTDEE